MEAFLLLVLTVLVLVLLSKIGQLRSRIDGRLGHIEDELEAVKYFLTRTPAAPPKKETAVSPIPPPAAVMPAPEPEKPKPAPLPAPPAVVAPKPMGADQTTQPGHTPPDSNIPAKEKPLSAIPVPAPPPEPVFTESWYDRFVRNNPDLEKFIGENLANKIGIAILVLGIGFFVKYAIDNEWINETARIAIGLGCGALLTGFAHYLRKQYRSFSSVLVGGGLAVFYFTIAFAYHEYRLLSQPVAFGSMVIITIFAVILALLYQRIEIAILATVGGFMAPFLVSSGSGNYVALFTYLIILNSGILVLAYFKRWYVLNVLALGFTVVIFGAWLSDQLLNDENSLVLYKNGLLFASIFYVMFMAINIINQLRTGSKFRGYDFGALLAINALYYAAGIACLMQWQQQDFKGLFTATLGLMNFGLAWVLIKRQQIDKNFLYLLIGLTLTYISLAAPVQLEGNNITLFWATECVLLYWLYQRSQIALMKPAALGVAVLAAFSLFMDWDLYNFPPKLLTPVFNRVFITGLVTGLAYLAFYALVRKASDTIYYGPFISNTLVKSSMLVAAIFILLIAGALEVHYQASQRIDLAGAPGLYLCLYLVAFANILSLALRKPTALNMNLRTGILVMAFLVFAGNTGNSYQTAIEMSNRDVLQAHFASFWGSVLLLLFLVFTTIQLYRRQPALFVLTPSLVAWMFSLMPVITLVIAAAFGYSWLRIAPNTNFATAMDIFSKAGITITLALCSFAITWLGFKFKNRTLRIISLSIFSLALLKLFFSDIRDISPGGKIAAFILLGVLLLVVSFMYQRLKKLFTEDSALSNHPPVTGTDGEIRRLAGDDGDPLNIA